MAIDLIKRNKCHNFIIVEKSTSIGGTWHDNKYPGCCCDVWSMLYSYSFEQNPEWTRRYPGQEEILVRTPTPSRFLLISEPRESDRFNRSTSVALQTSTTSTSTYVSTRPSSLRCGTMPRHAGKSTSKLQAARMRNSVAGIRSRRTFWSRRLAS